MKKSLLWIIILVTAAMLFPGGPRAQSVAASDSARILLIDPSQGDLEDMIMMIETGVVPIAHPALTAVYGAAVERNWSAIKSRIQARQLDWVHFEIVAGELDRENLFRENPCTEAFRRLFQNSDAALFYGGADIPPAAYGQKTDLLTGILTPNRHFFELSFLFHLLGGKQNGACKPLLEEKPGYVVRGFCLGMQTLNVAAGGTLYQDIPSEIYKLRYVEDYIALEEGKRHDNYWSKLEPHENIFWCHFQPIRFAARGFFVTEMNLGADEHPLVCSSHHQAIRDLGKDLIVAATSLDGKVVEAVTHKRYKNVLGVQFHPEQLAIYQQEGAGSKLTPADTALTTMHDYMQQRGGLEFHRKFWRQFAGLLPGGPKSLRE